MTIPIGRTSIASRTRTLQVGDPAPEFDLPGHRGEERVRLIDFRGRKMVLIFYPLDWTPV